MPKNDARVETGGTHLQGEVDAGYDELVELFGEPGEGDGYKVDAHWALQFDDGTVATVYNYKDGPSYLEDAGTPVAEIRDWHVGGFTPAAARLVRAALDAHRAAREPGPLVPISTLRPERRYLVRATWRGEPVRFRCDADDWNHAAEQALDAYPGAAVNGIER